MSRKKLKPTSTAVKYVHMKEDTMYGTAKEYVFRVDPAQRKVSGTLMLRFLRPVPYVKTITYECPVTRKVMRKFEADFTVEEFAAGSKLKGITTASKRDHWDGLVGVAICKFKLDLQNDLEVEGKPRSWKKIKEMLAIEDVSPE